MEKLEDLYNQCDGNDGQNVELYNWIFKQIVLSLPFFRLSVACEMKGHEMSYN